jgi:glycosyltransferase involved in cell wall biosynthesis
MNVAVYYPWIYLKSGAERIISELWARSRHRWTIITNRYEAEATFPSLKGANVVELRRVSVNRSFGCVAGAAWIILRQRLPLKGQDALVVICEGLGDLVTFRNHQIPTICICLTPLRAAFDPYYQAEYLRRNQNRWYRRVTLRSAAAAFEVIDRYAWKRYDRVFAISQEIKKRIIRGKLCAESKVSVLYPGVDCSRLTPSGIFKKVFLMPGRIMWTKNLQLGIDAFRLFRSRRPDLADFKLVISGFVDRKSQPYLAMLRERAAGCPDVLFVESPSDDVMFRLYAEVYAVLYTPFNEDFGLVTLEAGAFGKPLIAVNRGGPRESVLNGENGFLVEPEPEAFARAMEVLADDPALVRRMGAAARVRAQQFDCSHFYGVLDDCLEKAVSGEPLADARYTAASFDTLGEQQ